MNKVLILGKVAFDPDLRKVGNNQTVCNLVVNTYEKRKDDKPSFEAHRVVAWGATAEACGRYLKKDSQVFIEGKMRTEKYTDKNGIEKQMTKVMVDSIRFLEGIADKKTATEDDVPF